MDIDREIICFNTLLSSVNVFLKSVELIECGCSLSCNSNQSIVLYSANLVVPPRFLFRFHQNTFQITHIFPTLRFGILSLNDFPAINPNVCICEYSLQFCSVVFILTILISLFFHTVLPYSSSIQTHSSTHIDSSTHSQIINILFNISFLKNSKYTFQVHAIVSFGYTLLLVPLFHYEYSIRC